jgi:hypothetical protein
MIVSSILKWTIFFQSLMVMLYLNFLQFVALQQVPRLGSWWVWTSDTMDMSGQELVPPILRMI